MNNKSLGQKNGQKSQATIPASLIPHLLKGLTRLGKVAFQTHQVASCKTLIPRMTELAAKPVIEHRTRMSSDEAKTCHDALTIQAEWLKGGCEAIPANFIPAQAYFKAFAAGTKTIGIPKDPAPVAPVAPVEVIDAGVVSAPIADVVAANIEG
jgi:hypothetical protein